MPVDSFKFLPRLIAAFYQRNQRSPELPIPWTPLEKPLSACTFGLVTTAGLHTCNQPPFDTARELLEPAWGDPSYRILPADISQSDLAVSHLHINPQPILDDMNVVLPLERLRQLAAEGVIAGLAAHAYSFMGYQGFPPDTTAWRETYASQVAAQLRADGADCVLLTPA